MDFKSGDIVRNKSTGELDEVVAVPGMKYYDSVGYVSAKEGMLLKNGVWHFQDQWELVEFEPNFSLLHYLRIFNQK